QRHHPDHHSFPSRRSSGLDAWAPVYDDWASVMTEDVPYYTDLVREADGPVVELMVGSGRVAIPAARGGDRNAAAADHELDDRAVRFPHEIGVVRDILGHHGRPVVVDRRPGVETGRAS